VLVVIVVVVAVELLVVVTAVVSPNVTTPVNDLPSSSYLQFHSFSLFRASLQVPHSSGEPLVPGRNYR